MIKKIIILGMKNKKVQFRGQSLLEKGKIVLKDIYVYIGGRIHIDSLS